MKLFSKKPKTLPLIAFGLNIVFLAMLIYDAWVIRSLYKTLNEEQPYQNTSRIVRINTKELDKAVKRYDNSVNYVLPAVNVPDPYSR